MPNKMLIDASHPEETRVVVVRGNRIEEFDFESQDKKQLKGNIYLARVTRVEPSLQAAFVEYGGNRHGFLAFSEIHPDYYQIPVADRQAILRAEAEAAASEDEDDDAEERGRGRRRRRGGGRNRGRASDASRAEGADGSPAAAGDEDADAGEPAQAAGIDGDVVSEELPAEGETDAASATTGDDGDEAAPNGDDGAEADDDNGGGNGEDDDVVSVGAEDAMEEVRERRKPVRRQYKIQEVVKRRQILLVQVVKEERGNKGAALTTYLSLAGRYSVLMPNTARGGGISRKITNVQDRKRLKDVVKDLDVPQGMGVILRTAGESRTKAEIKRDYEYLMRLWDNVRTLTLQSSAPALVYEEGSLIKRSVRDLYNKDISEILVAGDDGYREAKDFMRMLMPSHAKVVQPYRDTVPIFARNGIEAQLDKMLQPQVTLKSGGYIIINQTEALVSIDVNSGRSTKEHSIEDTALQTNLEAAEEVARQLRLRDLAGLIVIDFIDMEENRNNRAVEKKMKDCLKNDRARIQVGRISHFGLLEMSRQRIRASVLESTMQPCPHCGGTGYVRSESSVALLVVRAIEEFLLKDTRNHITVRTPTSTAIYVLNNKRSTLVDMEARFGLTITIEADESVRSQHYAIVKGAAVENPVVIAPVAPAVAEDDDIDDVPMIEDDDADEAGEARAEQRADEGDGQRRRKRRRRRRGGRDRERTASEDGDVASGEAETEADGDATGEDEAEVAAAETADADESAGKKRRRGRRGGRRNRREDDDNAETASDAEGNADEEAMTAIESAGGDAVAAETAPAPEPEAAAEEAAPEEKPKTRARRAPKKAKATEADVAEAVADLDEPTAASEKPKRTRRKKVAEPAPEEPAEVAEATQAVEVATETVEAEPDAKPRTSTGEPVVTSSSPAPGEAAETPRKVGWWQRKSFF